MLLIRNMFKFVHLKKTCWSNLTTWYNNANIKTGFICTAITWPSLPWPQYWLIFFQNTDWIKIYMFIIFLPQSGCGDLLYKQCESQNLSFYEWMNFVKDFGLPTVDNKLYQIVKIIWLFLNTQLAIWIQRFIVYPESSNLFIIM
jgi:hypothetical protein